MHIASGLTMSGNVKVHLGTGTTVMQYKKIGKFVIGGVGSFVIDNLPANCKAVGISSRILKS